MVGVGLLNVHLSCLSLCDSTRSVEAKSIGTKVSSVLWYHAAGTRGVSRSVFNKRIGQRESLAQRATICSSKSFPNLASLASPTQDYRPKCRKLKSSSPIGRRKPREALEKHHMFPFLRGALGSGAGGVPHGPHPLDELLAAVDAVRGSG